MLAATIEDERPRFAARIWHPPSVVLGRNQPLSDVDLEYCRRRGLPLFRRETGGTGVFHHGDLLFSLSLPRNSPHAGLHRAYDVLIQAFREGALRLGLMLEPPPSDAPCSVHPVCFFGLNRETLLLGGRKVMGCSQLRRARGVLVHGSLLLSLDPSAYGAPFGIPGEEIARRLASLPRSVDPATLVRETTRALARILPDIRHHRGKESLL